MIGYTSIGSGLEKVIVLHGWKMDHSCFDGLHSSLHADDFTYVFADQRGYGLSINQPGPYDIVQTTSDIVALADELQWTRFHFIGHSMAGKVLCRLLADVPDRIKSAIGITPCPPVKIPFDDEGWQLFSSAAENEANRQEIFRLSTGDRLSSAWYESITKQSLQASTPAAFADYLDAWVSYQCFEDIIGCVVPVKILPGEFDPHLTAAIMQETYGQWLKHVEIEQLGNCGHYPMYEIPLRLAAACEEFIRRNSSA